MLLLILHVFVLAVVVAQEFPDVPNVCEFRYDEVPPLVDPQQTSRGHPTGTLIIAGGSLVSRDVYDTFWDIAGANDSRIIFIPTNGGGTFNTPAQIEASIQNLVTLSGWNRANIIFFHTYDREVADDPAFAAIIDTATAVWMSGGRHNIGVDAYGHFKDPSESLLAIYRLLDRGGLFGGSSAGALIQSDVMIRGASGDIRKPIYYGNDHVDGFAFVTNLVIDVHLLPRRYNDDMNEVIAFMPHVLGMGVDEDTALLLKGDEAQVIGNRYVTVVDYTLWSDKWYCSLWQTIGTGRPRLANGGRYFFLSPGDIYNVRTREVIATAKEMPTKYQGYF